MTDKKTVWVGTFIIFYQMITQIVYIAHFKADTFFGSLIVGICTIGMLTTIFTLNHLDTKLKKNEARIKILERELSVCLGMSVESIERAFHYDSDS
jgi:hypothetical protein